MKGIHAAELPDPGEKPPSTYGVPVNTKVEGLIVINHDILRCIGAIESFINTKGYKFSNYDLEIVDRSLDEFLVILIDSDNKGDVMGHRMGFYEMTIQKKDCYVGNNHFVR